MSSSSKFVANVLLVCAVGSASQALAQTPRSYIVGVKSQQRLEIMANAIKDFTLNSGHFGAAQRRADQIHRGRSSRGPLLAPGVVLKEVLDGVGLAVVEAPQGSKSRLEALLSQDSELSFVEPEMFYQLTSLDAGFRRLDDDGEFPWGITKVRANQAWDLVANENDGRGRAGGGTRVMVLDTGIDRDHPDLVSRFESGKDFVSIIPDLGFFRGFQHLSQAVLARNPLTSLTQPLDNNSEDAKPTPPYPYFDQNGHGTHVAGTIAGEADGKGVIGVAPQTRILAGRVCGKIGCSTVGIIKGINWAIEQKVDVVSMSLGGPQPSDAVRQAMRRAEDAGVLTIAASGNDGTAKISFPAGYETVFAVGASDRNNGRAVFSQYGEGLDIVAPGVDVTSSIPVGSGRGTEVVLTLNGGAMTIPSSGASGSRFLDRPETSNLKFAGIGKPEDFIGQSYSGHYALIQRGEITFVDKVKNAIAAGADGVVIFNNENGLIDIDVSGAGAKIPVVFIDRSVGMKARDVLTEGGTASSTVRMWKTNYARFQGTSMATPHVSGVAALVLAARRNLRPVDVRRILKESAVRLNETDALNEYGAGLVNAEAAVRQAIAER